jgi:hypothetical protein
VRADIHQLDSSASRAKQVVAVLDSRPIEGTRAYSAGEIAELKTVASRELHRLDAEANARKAIESPLNVYATSTDERSPDVLIAARLELAAMARRFLAESSALDQQLSTARPHLQTALEGLQLMALTTTSNHTLVDPRHPVKGGCVELERMGLRCLESAAIALIGGPFADLLDLARVRTSLARAEETYRALIDQVDRVRRNELSVSDLFPESELFAACPQLVGKTVGEILRASIEILQGDRQQSLVVVLDEPLDSAIANLVRIEEAMRQGKIIRREQRWIDDQRYHDTNAVSASPFHQFDLTFGGPLSTFLGVLNAIETNDASGLEPLSRRVE